MPQHFNMLFWRSTTTIALIVLVAIDYTKNYSVAAAFSQGTGAPNAERVLTINNRKEHVYSYSSMLKDTRTNADSEGAVVFEVDTENEMIPDRRRKKWISASVSLDMPFPAEIAFDTFSDLTRQPQWSPWLRSVIYLDEVKEVVQMNKNEYRIDSPSMPLRETKWTLGIKGFDFSWRAVSTLIDRPHRIGWKSTSGVNNEGMVKFDRKSVTTFDDNTNDGETGCIMTLKLKFVAPRVVASLFRRASFVETFFEGRLLAGTLERFRVVVLNDLRDDDVPLNTDKIKSL